jgi:NAD(P)-dependent dehydrogenase (short-subunit alcohol dehydrogenase family)
MSTNTKVALITGANKGIGFEVARQLATKGFTVLLGSRDPQRGAEAAARIPGAEAIALDLNNPETIAAAARQIEQTYGHLDVLVNNAGIAIFSEGRPGVASLDAVRETFETNFFGALAVTQAVLPLLRKSEAARIVNVSSTLGSLTFQSDPANPFADFRAIGYPGSKAALNMFTVVLAAELRDTPIKVNSACPGYVATDINNHSGPRTVEQGAAIIVHLATLPPDGPTGGFFDDNGTIPW